MRTVRTDFVLWLGMSGTIYLVLCVAWMVSLDISLHWASRHIVDFMVLAVPSIIIGWLAHSFALEFGFRLSGRPPSDQAADFDDRPLRPPPTA